jgi:hypothetical protein
MRRKFTYTNSFILLIVAAIWMSFAFTPHKPIAKKDTTPSFTTKKPKKKGFLNISIPSINLPFIKSSSSNSTPPIKVNSTVLKQDGKLIQNVQVYPTTITDQINLKYSISRNSNVSVKITDILGNEVATLCSGRFEPGAQSCNYYLTNKISKGFYFIRVVAGTELVIRRISIL